MSWESTDALGDVQSRAAGRWVDLSAGVRVELLVWVDLGLSENGISPNPLVHHHRSILKYIEMQFRW